MKIVRIFPYKLGSKSARVLSNVLHGLRVRLNGFFRQRNNHLVINWGNPNRPRWWVNGLNYPQNVAFAISKDIALEKMRDAGVSIVDFTRDQNTAQEWVNNGKVVVGRAILNGHGGIGCRVYSKDGNRVVDHLPLYTKHLRHKREFRIHVVNGSIIDMVEKRKRVGVEERNAWIRNLHNGYVFCREGIEVPQCVRDEAVKATAALGLHFGAVDIGYRVKDNKAFVFEVNTAPGVEGTTILRYAEAFRQIAARD
jgi:hypothetical protein